MRAFVLLLVQYWMPMALLVVAGGFAGFAVNRGKRLDGAPVARGVNVAALVLSILSIVVPIAMEQAHAAVGLLSALPRATIAADAAAAVLLAASAGSLARRRIAREVPPARWTRLDAACGMLALIAPLVFAIVIVGAIASPGAYTTSLRIAAAIPLPFALAAVHLSMATRPDRPAERVRKRDIGVAIVGGIFAAQATAIALVENAAHGRIGDPLVPIFAGVALAIIVIEEVVNRRRVHAMA